MKPLKIKRAVTRTGLTLTLQPNGSYRPSVMPARDPGRAVKMYDAGRSSRLTADWTEISRLSADGELQGRLPVMRSRSREGEQNNAYHEAYLKLRENNVVGHDGFTLQMKVKKGESIDAATGEVKIDLDHAANRAIERAWTLFSQRKNFLVTRDMHATEACKLIERTGQRDGDLLIRKVNGAPNEFGFALQLLEADYLDDQFIDFRGVACNCPEERTLPDGRPFPYCARGMHEVRMGVELHGDWKFPVAYWLLANHPGDYFWGNQYATRRIRVPVEEIIHPFIHKRIEQTRGIPATHAAMLRLHMIGGMDEATLVAARAGAQKMGIITKEIPDDIPTDENGNSGFDPNALAGKTIDGAPGEFLELPMGYDIKSIDWKNPDDAYAPFQKTQLRGASSALGVAYHSLTTDLESVNFSAGRLGFIEQREGFRGGQTAFIHDILLEAFPDFLQAAMLRGIVDLSFDRFADYTDPEAVCFHGKGFEFYDPTKDIEYAERAIALGIATRADFAAEGAKDFEQVTSELAREKKLRAAAGLKDEADLAAEAAAAKPEPSKPSEAAATKSLPATKSAYLGDCCIEDLPAHAQTLIGEFMPGATPAARVTRYQMTVPELVDKADQHNLDTARRRVSKRTIASSAAEVLERKDKHILILNDRIIDGHHHLAKAEKGKITSSLPVIDLTPLRYQG